MKCDAAFRKFGLRRQRAAATALAGFVVAPVAQERLWRICLVAAPALLLAGRPAFVARQNFQPE